MWERIKAHGRWLLCHRTKIVGGLGMAAGYAENNLAQLGHVIPDQYRGSIVAALGAIVFIIGVINSMNL